MLKQLSSQSDISRMAMDRLGYGIGDLVRYSPDMSHKRAGVTPKEVARLSGLTLGQDIRVEELRYLVNCDNIAIVDSSGLGNVLYIGTDFKKVDTP